MDIPISSSRRSTPFIVSLFIHLILLFVLFTYKEIIKEALTQSTEQKKDKKLEKPLGMSNVPLVKQIPKKQNAIRFQNPQTPLSSATQPAAIPASQESPMAANTLADISNEISPIGPKPTAYTTPEKIEPSTIAPTEVKKITEEPIPQKPIAHAPRTIAQSKAATPPPSDKIDKTVQQPGAAKQLTLKDITKGFFKTLGDQHGTGHDEARNPGVLQNSIDDARLLAFSQYKTKVCNQFLKSANLMNAKVHLSTDIRTTAQLLIIMHKNGSIQSLSLEHPQKNDSLLNLERILQEAAHSNGLYVPIPSQFNSETMTIKIPVRINQSAGTHPLIITYLPQTSLY